MKGHLKIMTLIWNHLNAQSREEICSGAAISKIMAKKRWEELELWIQLLLTDSLERRSGGRLYLGSEQQRNLRNI